MAAFVFDVRDGKKAAPNIPENQQERPELSVSAILAIPNSILWNLLLRATVGSCLDEQWLSSEPKPKQITL